MALKAKNEGQDCYLGAQEHDFSIINKYLAFSFSEVGLIY